MEHFTEEQQKTYEDHILSKDLANALAKADKENYERAKDPEVVLCHVDLEKVLLLPQTKASCAYYKRKLTALNFTIFDIVLCGMRLWGKRVQMR